MYEIVVHAHPFCEEAILAFLEERNIQPAVVEMPSLEKEKSVVFYLSEKDWEAFEGEFLEKLREVSRIFGVAVPRVSVAPLDDASWRDTWKRYARIYRFGGELIVKPSWRKLRKPPSCPVVSVDPRMAFGTGGHASTRLCIYHLLHIRRERPGCLREVLDVGTGSGILSIVAVKLGAGRVVATDIDPDAIEIARENAVRNNVASRIEFALKPLDEIPGKFSLILANIYETVLSELLGEFSKHLRPDGLLVVSGLTAEQGRGFVGKAERFGLRKVMQRFSRSWVSYGFEGVK